LFIFKNGRVKPGPFFYVVLSRRQQGHRPRHLTTLTRRPAFPARTRFRHYFFMPDSALILNAAAMRRALARIAHEIAERNESSTEVVIVGIQRGGVHLAQRLSAILGGIWGHAVPAGSLDVSMHRDDLDQRLTPDVHPTIIPFDIAGKTVVLVDDVLFKGARRGRRWTR